MAMKLQMDMRLSQRLVMTPQLQQAIKLLQMSRLELEQTVSEYLTENPLLEEFEEVDDADERAISWGSFAAFSQGIDRQQWDGFQKGR